MQIAVVKNWRRPSKHIHILAMSAAQILASPTRRSAGWPRVDPVKPSREQKYLDKGWGSLLKISSSNFSRSAIFLAAKKTENVRQKLADYRTACLFDDIYQSLQSPNRSSHGRGDIQTFRPRRRYYLCVARHESLVPGRPPNYFCT